VSDRSGICEPTISPEDSVSSREAARPGSDTDGLLADDKTRGEGDLVGVLGAREETRAVADGL
jgi:hypothetical protein